MKKLRTILNKILELLAGLSFFVMVALTCWQVFTRYVLARPSSWSEELVSYLFAWMALFGACIVTGERGHMNIPVVVEHMEKRGRMCFSLFSELVAGIFSAVILVFGGIRITSLAMGQMTSSLGVPAGVFYVVLPISGLLNIAYTILNICEIVKKKEA